MAPGQRGPERSPGDLYVDPAVPADERLTTACGGWTAAATHVWTGTGWARLLVRPVRPVPGTVLPPGALLPVAALAADEGLRAG